MVLAEGRVAVHRFVPKVEHQVGGCQVEHARRGCPERGLDLEGSIM